MRFKTQCDFMLKSRDKEYRVPKVRE